MAIIPFQKVSTPYGNEVPLFKWSNMASGDVGEPVIRPRMSDKTIMALGDFGISGHIALEGTLDPSGTTYVPLRDLIDAAIQLSANDAVFVQQNVWKLRPRAVGGVVDVEVHLLGR